MSMEIVENLSQTLLKFNEAYKLITVQYNNLLDKALMDKYKILHFQISELIEYKVTQSNAKLFISKVTKFVDLISERNNWDDSEESLVLQVKTQLKMINTLFDMDEIYLMKSALEALAEKYIDITSWLNID